MVKHWRRILMIQSEKGRSQDAAAGAPLGGSDIPAAHVPAPERLVASRIRLIPSDTGSDAAARILLFRCALAVSGFEVKTYDWADQSECYVFYDHARHAELFVLLQNHGFQAVAWATGPT
jgi:hypothetical protein